jgi:DNA polymerase V
MYALVDGNNFYVSCERVFQPILNGRPVVVLSSNDGCAIARSNEAKALGIKMGAPWFQIRHLEREAGLIGFSANFTLYGDMSTRMMRIAADLGPTQEIYSIDESFIGLHGVRDDVGLRAWTVRNRILDWIGIPCGVGIGPTKTLAKLANHIAKSAERKPGSYPSELATVCNLAVLPMATREAVMAATEVGDVWGVGPRIGKQLRDTGVLTALDLARMSPSLVRERWSVVLERTVRELQGESCLAIEDAPPPKKQIAHTRSFGQPISDLDGLIEAVSSFTVRAAEKLRQQGSVTRHVSVFAHTSPFRSGPHFSRSVVVALPRPTSDTRPLVQAAIRGIKRIYQPGFHLSKAGVMLLDLAPESVCQGELFEQNDSVDSGIISKTLDVINARFGRGAIQLGSSSLKNARRDWAVTRERLSPQYTTRWEDLPIVRA